MTMLDTFPATRQDALDRVSAVRPGDYARSRNAIEGAVTGLSPYITHGLVSLPEELTAVAAKHSLDIQHKFVFELGWREYFRHVWAFRGEGIWSRFNRHRWSKFSRRQHPPPPPCQPCPARHRKVTVVDPANSFMVVPQCRLNRHYFNRAVTGRSLETASPLAIDLPC